MNYKVNRRLLCKPHKRSREGRESLEDDFRSRLLVNVKLHNLAESLMGACINTGTVQYHKMKITADVFKQF